MNNGLLNTGTIASVGVASVETGSIASGDKAALVFSVKATAININIENKIVFEY